MKESDILLDYLKSSMYLDLTTGKVFWKSRAILSIHDSRWNGRFAGKEVGSKTKEGYLRTTIVFDGKPVSLLLHRVVWGLAYGSWPTSDIDHINQIKSDNSLGNLRLCTRAQNIANRKQKTSIYKGVSYDKRHECFYSRIMLNGEYYHLGTFQDAISAALAYDEAAKKLYGDFADTNF